MTNLKTDATSDMIATPWESQIPTGLLVFADGTVIKAKGAGASGAVAGEVCFNTAMTGYQEILTDLSYARQIVTFTFPHIGNVGTNDDDMESASMPDTADAARTPGAVGAIFRCPITQPSNYRANQHLDQWLKSRNIIALTDIDTRALTAHIRQKGMPNAVIAHDGNGKFDVGALTEKAAGFQGIENSDLAGVVTTSQRHDWLQSPWVWPAGFATAKGTNRHIIVIDYGAKSNILRELTGLGARVTVVSARTGADEILALNPDGIMLSNGPGDPAATGDYAIPILQALVASGTPIFGICLGHQLLALALGASTQKMHQGHHGANHPVKDETTGKVEITSMNHGFTVASGSLPEGITETHRSLFDGTNCGLAVDGKPIFSVQYHPEASPGPHDSHYLFERFLNNVEQSMSA